MIKFADDRIQTGVTLPFVPQPLTSLAIILKFGKPN